MVRIFLSFILCVTSFVSAKTPQITSETVLKKTDEILKAHVRYKYLTPELIERILNNYLEQLDAGKTYLVEEEVKLWTSPSKELVAKVHGDFLEGRFPEFERIHALMVNAIERRNRIEEEIQSETLPEKVSAEEFKDLKWCASEAELQDRLLRLRALQFDAASKIDDELEAKTVQRIEKRRIKRQEEVIGDSTETRTQFILVSILKSVASALDTHTAYFTPQEATQFMINVQQRLFGIGAQLRDDLNGFTVVRIVEGGPAHQRKDLKLRDRIVAVDGEPVVGMDIFDAVELIRGEEGTLVKLTVIREEGEEKAETKLDIEIERGEVVLKEARIESSYEPFGNGAIAYIKLHSFYQDPENSSAQDLREELSRLMAEHPMKGVILDLRHNSGGLLSQAVAVTGLFITKGVVVSIKDDVGTLQHLRDLDGKMLWDGPLVVLINRASASAAEIVAQTLQDYGRAIVVGDDHSYGKGSFQTFTLQATGKGTVDPQGEYKVTRGIYYTVSGKSPQLVGVGADVIVPGVLSEMDIGEQYAKYPLEGDHIPENFDDQLADVPRSQREKIKHLYKFDLQAKLQHFTKHVDVLAKNSKERVKNNRNYQNFLKEIKKNDVEGEESEIFGQNDLQLFETYNVMKDLILLALE